jgi:hypothetical protein
MFGANLALMVLLGQVANAGADPAALVDRLGSPHFAEREEAAGALEQLGRLAIPALRAARAARDPEIRTRAATVSQRIEGALLTQPSLVRLDFEDQPLVEVVKSLGEQTGMRLGLVPENAAQWQARRVTLHESTPVPFWKAMDRLCEVARLSYNLGMHGSPRSREPIFQLIDGGPRLVGPTSDSGPFRVSLVGLHYQRDVTFSPEVAGFPRRNFVPPPPAPPGVDPAPGHAPVVSEQFYAQVQVTAEPRLSVSMNGPLKVLEAVDNRGQSLLPEPGEGVPTQRFSGYFGLNTAALQLQAALRRPGQPGQSIRKLRGSLPVLVATRKPDPLVVTLQGASGKVFRNDEVTLSILDIRTAPATNQTSLEVVVRPNQPPTASIPGGANGPEFLIPRQDLQHQQQMEVVDTQGRVIGWYQASTFDAEGSRMTLTLTPQDPQAIPAELRYYGLARAVTEVGFEFSDVLLP